MKILLIVLVVLAVGASATDYQVAIKFLNPCESLESFEAKDSAWYFYDQPQCEQQLEEVFWADVMSLQACPHHRVKKDIHGFFKTAGMEALKVVSNLLESKSEPAEYGPRFNDLEQNVKAFQGNFSMTHTIMSDFLDYLQMISPATKSHKAVLEQIAKKNSMKRFGVTRVQGAILSRAADIEAIKDKCMEGKMATAELGELANNETISKLDAELTTFVGVKIDKNERQVVFNFKVKDVVELNFLASIIAKQGYFLFILEIVAFAGLEYGLGYFIIQCQFRHIQSNGSPVINAGRIEEDNSVTLEMGTQTQAGPGSSEEGGRANEWA